VSTAAGQGGADPLTAPLTYPGPPPRREQTSRSTISSASREYRRPRGGRRCCAVGPDGEAREDRPGVAGAATPAGGSAAIKRPPMASGAWRLWPAARSPCRCRDRCTGRPDDLHGGFDAAGPAGPGRMASEVAWARIKEVR
jgi:hypothetical protein